MLTDEQITKKKKFAGEKIISMKRRDDHHDYTERRMYMITIEVEGRRQRQRCTHSIVGARRGSAARVDGHSRLLPANRGDGRTDDARPHAWHPLCEGPTARAPGANHLGL